MDQNWKNFPILFVWYSANAKDLKNRSSLLQYSSCLFKNRVNLPPIKEWLKYLNATLSDSVTCTYLSILRAICGYCYESAFVLLRKLTTALIKPKQTDLSFYGMHTVFNKAQTTKLIQWQTN